MAVIKNTFIETLDSVTYSTRTINGLTSAISTTNVNNVSPEISKHFLRSIYQTLLDAGYSDTVLNEEDYSITVLGFKFFVLCTRYSANYECAPDVYVYGLNGVFSYTRGGANDTFGINSYKTNEKELKYHITVRGDSNCVYIYYTTQYYPNCENPLIFIAKAKNLITSGEAFMYSCSIDKGATANPACIWFREKDNLYNSVHDSNSYFDFLRILHTDSSNITGLNTSTKFVRSPVLGYYGSYLVYSMIVSNKKIFEPGKYYKIGSDIYYCHGSQRYGTGVVYGSNSPLLFKVSD